MGVLIIPIMFVRVHVPQQYLTGVVLGAVRCLFFAPPHMIKPHFVGATGNICPHYGILMG